MEELISKRDAIEVIEDELDKIDHVPQWVFDRLTNRLRELPPAQPERIKARWILAENQRPDDMENDNYLFICSNCGSTDLHSKRVPVPYCWNCGAEMLREMTEWMN